MKKSEPDVADPIKEADELRKAKMSAVWPHLRGAIRKRLLLGERMEDLAGVVTETPGGPGGDETLTVGVLTRSELAEAIAENPSDKGRRWIDWLRAPAPEGCIYVFSAFGGLPDLLAMGPVFPAELAN